MSVELKLKKLKSSETFPEVLGIQRYYEFVCQIISGISSRSLAKQLQRDGFFVDIKKETLAQRIRFHRKENILPKAKRFLDLESKTNVSKADKIMSENRNIANELSELIGVQKVRVEKGFGRENKNNKNYAYVNRDIRLLGNLLDSYGHFQIKAGLINSIGNNFYGNLNEDAKITEQIQKFLADKEKHEQIASATRKALKVLSRMEFNTQQSE